MFYDKYVGLCSEKKISPSKAATEIGLNKASVTNWKKNGYTPRTEVLQRIANYFEVPLDFLLGRPPFDHWELINQNRRDFLHYVAEDLELLDLIWGIDYEHPEQTPAKDFIAMLAQCVESAYPNEDGGWTVVMRPTNQTNEKAPTQEGERSISDREIMFALWGDTTDVDESDLEDVKRYAAFVRERKRKS